MPDHRQAPRGRQWARRYPSPWSRKTSATSRPDTLKEFGRDPKHHGGTLGFTAILRTWDQVLRDHVHLHCLIPAGALSPDGTQWLRAREDFLFPVKEPSETGNVRSDA